METTTIHSYLMLGTTSSGTTTYAELICIKDYPDFLGTPETVEITTLCDKVRRFLEGLKSNDQLEFTANYTKENLSAILALAGEQQKLSIWFGAGTGDAPDGHDGKFDFNGFVSARVNGGGVGDVREMTVIVTPSSEITPNLPQD